MYHDTYCILNTVLKYIYRIVTEAYRYTPITILLSIQTVSGATI